MARPILWERTPDKLPCLPAAFLAKHGFLAQQMAGPVFKTNNALVFPIKTTGSLLDLFTEFHDRLYHLLLEFGKFPGPNGDHAYFVCPKTKRYCLKVYFYKGTWASSAGHRLRAGGTAALRQIERRRQSIAQRLTAKPIVNRHNKITRESDLTVVQNEVSWLGFVPPAYSTISSILEQLPKVKRARRRRNSKRLATYRSSTAAALEQGYELEKPTVARLSALAMDQSRQIHPLPDEFRPRAVLEDHATLNLNELRRSFLFQADESCGYSLGWDADLTNGERLVLIIVEELQALHLLIVFAWPKRDSKIQLIEFGMRPGIRGRLFLKCPVFETLHDRLYFRDGYFASAQAQRLYHRSQGVPRASKPQT